MYKLLISTVVTAALALNVTIPFVEAQEEDINLALGKTVITLPISTDPSHSNPQAIVNGKIDEYLGEEKWFVEDVYMRTSYAIIDLESVCKINKIVVHSGYHDGREMLTDFIIQYANEGKWVDIPEAAIAGSTEISREITLDTQLVTHAIKIMPTRSQLARYRIREIQVFGQEGEVADPPLSLPVIINPMSLPILPIERVSTLGYKLIKPPKTDKVLLNPSKGWVMYGLPDTHTSETMSLGTVGYIRYEWAEIEPVENQYNWSLIDSAIEAWSNQGKKFAFRIMPSNAFTTATDGYVTPKWVFDAGAQSVYLNAQQTNDGESKMQYVPVWDHPIYIQKLTKLTNAVADRYDNNPNVEFIDLGGYGHYGEYHVGGLDGSTMLSNSQVWDNVMIFRNAFENMRLIMPIGHTSYYQSYNNALDSRIGIRHDGVMNSDPYMGEEAQGKQPIVFEFHASYGALKNSTNPNMKWSNEKLVKAVEGYYPSYIGMGHHSGIDAQRMVDDDKPFMEMLANRMGYWFSIDTVVLPNKTSANTVTEFTFDWRNAGVSYIYNECYLAIALLNSNGDVVQTHWIDHANPKNWEPNKVTSETYSISFDQLTDGTYKLAVGLFSNKDNPTPDYKIGNQFEQNGWYVITDNLIAKNQTMTFDHPLPTIYNVALGKTVTDSFGFVENNSNPGALVDGVTTESLGNNKWYPQGAFKNAWAEIDLQDRFIIREIKMFNGYHWQNDPIDFLNDFVFQYYDGKDWKDILGTDLTGFNDFVYTKVLEQPITATKIRVVAHESQSVNFRLREIEVFGYREGNFDIIDAKYVVADTMLTYNIQNNTERNTDVMAVSGLFDGERIIDLALEYLVLDGNTQQSIQESFQIQELENPNFKIFLWDGSDATLRPLAQTIPVAVENLGF